MTIAVDTQKFVYWIIVIPQNILLRKNTYQLQVIYFNPWKVTISFFSNRIFAPRITHQLNRFYEQKLSMSGSP